LAGPGYIPGPALYEIKGISVFFGVFGLALYEMSGNLRGGWSLCFINI
jgi:hypothetical protein